MQDGRRKRLSQHDSDVLIEVFSRNPRPTPDERNYLARQLGLNSRSIQIWFQNRRAKLKKEAHDPDLFSTKTAAAIEEPSNLPVISAINFKEMCLPKYLDIPIRGQQLSTEDISKNDAIRMYWKRQQEFSKESEMPLPDDRFVLSQQENIVTPPSSASKGHKRPRSDIENDKKGYNMPDLLPFTDIGSKMDLINNMNFLNQSVKQISDQDFLKVDYFKPQIDMIAADLNFLFDANIMSTSFDPKVGVNDQQFSEIFSVLSDMGV